MCDRIGETGIDARAHPGHHGIALRRPAGRPRHPDRHPQDVRFDLVPDRAAGATADAARVRAVNPAAAAASRLCRKPNAAPSMIARTMSALVEASDSPKKTPRASESQIGERSPNM